MLESNGTLDLNRQVLSINGNNQLLINNNSLIFGEKIISLISCSNKDDQENFRVEIFE